MPDLYTAPVGIICDRCGLTEERDYLVPTGTGQLARFEVARKALRREGWRCGTDGDHCPDCRRDGMLATKVWPWAVEYGHWLLAGAFVVLVFAAVFGAPYVVLALGLTAVLGALGLLGWFGYARVRTWLDDRADRQHKPVPEAIEDREYHGAVTVGSPLSARAMRDTARDLALRNPMTWARAVAKSHRRHAETVRRRAS